MSERHFRRLRDRYEAEGAEGLIDRRRGRVSGRRVPVDRIEWLPEQYRTRYFDFTIKHFLERLRTEHKFELGYTWTKRTLQVAGLVKRAPKRSAHRKKRPRRPLPGMMLFQDGSSHAWLAGRPPLDLIVTLDDATSALVARLAVRIGGGLPPPCQVVIEAGIVPPERADSWYEADLAVTCAGLSGRQFVAEPVLIVEVLSPSPAATDRDRKLPDYRRIGSLEDILVVSSTEPRIERFRREEGGWRVQDYAGSGTVSLEAFGITLELGELYAGVLAPAT